MLEVNPFWPISGGSWLFETNWVDATPGIVVGETIPLVDVDGGALNP
jgi:hypothetical protein